MKHESTYIKIMRFLFRILCPGYHLAGNPPKGLRAKSVIVKAGKCDLPDAE